MNVIADQGVRRGRKFDQVLEGARTIFMRDGFERASVDDIAREAGVTPALLHYYFGDKPQLQAAVVEERLMPVMAMLREPLQQAGDNVAALIAGFVGGVGKIAIAHPWLPPLWVREVLCEGGALRDVMFQRVGPVIPQMMAARFAAAQARGEIQSGLDPRLLMVSLVGLTLFPIAGAPIWRQLFEADDLDIETLRRHTLALLDRGVGIE